MISEPLLIAVTSAPLLAIHLLAAVRLIMRFKIEKPKFDQVRYIKKFALFPFTYGAEPKQTVIWFEWYWQRQKTSGNYYWYNAGKFPIEHTCQDATC